MEILFNKEIDRIDFESLSYELKHSNVSDINVEHNIIDSIWNSQTQQLDLLRKLESYVENIRKYSTNTIDIKRWQLVLDKDYVTVLAGKAVVDNRENDGIIGLSMRSDLIQLYSPYFWMLGDTVQLKNMINNIDNLKGGTDLVSTKEMLDFYFLQNRPNEDLFKCRCAYIKSTVDFNNIPEDLAINRSDAKKFFFLKTDKIPMRGRIVNTTEYLIDEKKTKANNFIAGRANIAKRIIAKHGAVTLKDALEDYLRFDDPYISDNASIPEGVPTNAMALGDVASKAANERAPFTGWLTVDLKKVDAKTQEFLDFFVDLVFSGNSISPDRLDKFMSVVAKKELDYILEEIRERLKRKTCKDEDDSDDNNDDSGE